MSNSEENLKLLEKKGWYVNTEYEFPNSQSLGVMINHLLDADIKEFGSSTGLNGSNLNVPRVLQLSKVIDVHLSLAQQEEGRESTGSARLHRIHLTDGKSTILCLDLDSTTQITCKSEPGTKILLNKCPQMQSGFFLLSNQCLSILGGRVEHLYHAWKMKMSVSKMNRVKFGTDANGPPPFVPFGSQQSGMYLARNPATDQFRALVPDPQQQGSAVKPAEEISEEFADRRREATALAAAAAANPAVANRMGDDPGSSTSTSKYAEKQRSRDLELRQLCDTFQIGIQLATKLMKDNNWDVTKASDSFMERHFHAHNEAQQLIDFTDKSSRGSKRASRSRPANRGGGAGRSAFDDLDDRHQPVDPNLITAVQQRAQMTLADFLPAAANQNELRSVTGRSSQPEVRIGSQILAECMDASFIPATIVDIDPHNKVFTVCYRDSNEVLEVCIESIRQVDSKKISLSQVDWQSMEQSMSRARHEYDDGNSRDSYRGSYQRSSRFPLARRPGRSRFGRGRY